MIEETKMISNVGSGFNREKRDIVTQIKDLYMRKFKTPEDQMITPLIPTRAALFGLDCRFREIDEKLNLKKIKKQAARKKFESNRSLLTD